MKTPPTTLLLISFLNASLLHAADGDMKAAFDALHQRHTEALTAATAETTASVEDAWYLELKKLRLDAVAKIDTETAKKIEAMLLAAGRNGVRLSAAAASAASTEEKTLEKIFPVGSTWKGTHEMDGEKINSKIKDSMKGKVLSVAGDQVKMEIQISGHAVRIYELKVSGSDVTLEKNEGVGKIPGTNIPANLIEIHESSGTITADALSALLKLDCYSTTTGVNGGFVNRFRWSINLKRN